MQELVQTSHKRLCSHRGLERIAQRHFFEGEQQVCSRLDPHRSKRNLVVFLLSEKRSKLRTSEMLLPLLMRIPLVVAFPSQVRLIPEAVRKCLQELATTSFFARGRTDTSGDGTLLPHNGRLVRGREFLGSE